MTYLKVNFTGKLTVHTCTVSWFFAKVHTLSNGMICIYIVLKAKDYTLKQWTPRKYITIFVKQNNIECSYN